MPHVRDDEVGPPRGDLDRLLEIGTDAQRDARHGRKHQHPTGWTPGVRLEKDGGYVVTDPREAAPDAWDEILDQLLPPGVDRDRYEVDGETVEVRAWDANVGEGNTKRLYYFKARLRLRTEYVLGGVNLDEIINAARKARIRKAPVTDQERAYWIQITDLQAGQGDGDGVAGMVERVLDLTRLAAEDLTALRKAGRPASMILVPITGDLVEGISGWYDMQTFSVELDRRDQTKLVRRLITEFLIEIASHGLPVHVATVPGNHGENRKDGRAFTSLGDNDDVAIIEQIADAFALAGNLEHVTFAFPGKNRLSLTIEVLGHVVGLTHGHLTRGNGVGTEGKMTRWFEKMAAIRDPLGDADILFSGHYHHARYQQLVGDTIWIQGGALCDASEWFSQSAGLVGDPIVMKGTITRDEKVESINPKTWQRTRP